MLVGIGLVLLPVLVLALLHLPVVQRALVRRALDAVQTSSDLVITVADVRLSPTRLAVVARGVRVAARTHPDVPLLQVEQMEVDVARVVLTSAGRTLAFEQVRLDRPVVHLRRDADGHWNLPLASPDSPEAETPLVTLEHLDVTGGTLLVEDALNDLALRVSDLTIAPTGGPFSLAGALQLRLAEASLEGRLDGAFDYDGHVLGLRPVTISTGASTLQLEGATNVDSGDLDVAAALRLDARDLRPFVAVPLTDTAHVTASVEGTTDAPHATWDLVAEQLTDGTLPPLDLDGSGTADTAHVLVEPLTGSLAGGRLSANGRVGFETPTPTELTLRLANARLHDLLRPVTPAPPVGGRLDLAMEARGTGLDWADWTTTTSLEVRSSPGAAAAWLPIDGVARAELRNRRWSLDANVASPGAAVLVAQADGQLAEDPAASTLRGHVRLDVDDLGAASASLAATAFADLSGRASVDARLEGSVSAPRMQWTLDATADTSLVAPVAVHATGTASLVQVVVDETTATSGPNTLSAQATVGLDGAQRLRGTFRAALPAVEALLADPVVAGYPLAGGAELAGDLRGTVASPEVRAHASLARMRVAGQLIDTASTELVFRDNQLRASDLVARAGDGRMSGTLMLDLGAERHEARLAMAGWPIRPLPAPAQTTPSAGDDGTAATGVPLAATLDATIDTSGQLARPSGSATFDLRDVTWQDHALGTLAARATSDGRQAEVTFDAPLLSTAGTAQIDLATTAFNLRARLDELTLEPIRPWLPASFERADGRLRADVSLTGRMDDLPASATGALRFDALDLTLEEASLSLESPVVLAVSKEMVEVQGLHLKSGDLAVRAEGAFGRSATLTPLTLTLTGPAAAARPWLEALQLEVPAITGDVHATATLAGTLEAPAPVAMLEATDVAVAVAPEPVAGRAASNSAPPLRIPRLTVGLDQGVVTLPPVTAEWDDARLTATARLPLRLARPHVPSQWHVWLGSAEGPATANLQTTALETRLLEPFVGADALANVSGRVTARLTAEASDITWSGLSAQLTLDEAAFSLSGLPLAQARPTVVLLDEGRVEVRDVLFSGPNTDLAIDGTADLTAPSPVLDLQVRGLTDLAVLRPFLSDIAPGGRAEVNLHARGTVAEPSVTGELLLTDASLRLAEPRLALELLNGTATFTGRQMAMPSLRGVANGAPVTISAALALGTDNTPGGQVRVRASGVPLEYPAGLRTESDVDILASIAGTRVDVTGEVDILRGIYREPIALAALSSGLIGGPTTDVTGEAEGTPLDVRFDVQVQTRDALRIDNNYGRLSADAALRLIGTLDQPALSGRVTVAEGGELYLGGLTYRVERGAVDFANPQRIEPIVDLAAETRTRGERIRIEASGTPDTLDVTLSAPDAATPLSQAELASLLVSGRTLDDLSGTAAGEQALGLLSADLLGVVGRGVGLDALRLDRDLLLDDRATTGDVDVAAETDPVARLTLAKRLRANVEVVYSQNLRDASEITWLVTWTPFRRIELRLLQRDDRSTSYEFRHEVVFGAPPSEPVTRETPPRVRAVEVVTPDAAMRDALLRQLRLDVGDRFDFYRWQDDRDRLEAWLRDARHYEHRLTARRAVDDGDDGPVVDLRYEVTPGPRGTLVVEGTAFDDDTRARMRDAWAGSVFDGFLRDDLARIAREVMTRDGHPLAEVQVTTTLSPDGLEKTATVAVSPGPSLATRLDVRGLDDPLSERFDAWLAAGASRTAWLDAGAFTTAARSWLRNRGALEAEVALSAPVRQADAAVRTVQVTGGVPYRLADVSVTGVPDVRRQQVRDELGLSSGDWFDAVDVDAARRTLERWYAAGGFRDADVELTTTAREETTEVDVVVTVREGPRLVVGESRIAGARLTHPALLERALALPLGTVATPADLLRARKRLYDTGVLSSVEVETTPAGPVAAAADGTLEQPVLVTGTVRELPRLRLRYGLAVNDDVLQDDAFRVSSSRRVTPGLSALLENRNLLGRAVVGGLSARYERARQSGRAFLTSPSLFGSDIRLQASSGLTRSRLVPDVADSPLDVRTDATLGATQRLPGLDGLRLTYGYRFERSRTYDPENLDLFDITITAPRLTSTVFVDRRDDPTDSTRGWFHASTLEVSRGWVGSDFEFLKYYGQQTAFWQVGRVVLAGRAQLGLGRGFGGQDLLGSERFFAGGAVSVRGYGESVIGELDPILGVARGDGLVVLNGEVRVPLWRWISGVGFVDGGGVFERVSDVTLGGLQWGTGAGVRVSTPAGLVRVDVGMPLQRRPLDKAWRVYVGLGQVF